MLLFIHNLIGGFVCGYRDWGGAFGGNGVRVEVFLGLGDV